MTAWVVRAGRSGEHEELALDKGLAVIGWNAVSDLSPIRSPKELEDLLRRTYPTHKRGTIANNVRQLWAFTKTIRVGDLIVLPLKHRAAIAVGRAAGPYQFRPELPENARHTRQVQWLDKAIPRAALTPDLKQSVNLPPTVYQMNSMVEDGIKAILEGSTPPRGVTPPIPTRIADQAGVQDGILETETDLDQTEPLDERSNLTFAVESHLRDFISRNLRTLAVKGSRLRLYSDESGRDGVEYPSDVGPIDILAVDEAGAFVVFELKLSKGVDRALGQLLRYMGWVKAKLAREGNVKGIIVAEAFDDKLKYAASVVPDVVLFEYDLAFKIREVGLDA